MTYQLPQDFIDDAMAYSLRDDNLLTREQRSFAKFHSYCNEPRDLEAYYNRIFAVCLLHATTGAWFDGLYGRDKENILAAIECVRSGEYSHHH